MKEEIKELAKLLEDLTLDEIKNTDGDIFNAYCCDEVTGSLIHKTMDKILEMAG